MTTPAPFTLSPDARFALIRDAQSIVAAAADAERAARAALRDAELAHTAAKGNLEAVKRAVGTQP